MQLLGMLDSPYVRRVAISMDLMGIDFEHRPLSVFGDFEAFAAINPVVKAPTLVTSDGTVLMDSTLILDHLETFVEPERRLVPPTVAERARAQRLVGLALAACEKTVQLVYEFRLRPPERQHTPWIDRVRGQLAAAYSSLEAEIETGETWLFGERVLAADVAVAVAWSFSTFVLPDEAVLRGRPKLARFAERAEALQAFRKAPMA
ncbi:MULTISPECIES: glutathione S-transferase family protein [unclassified Aureimonas]|uniref:glutathione S-transferase family protein n=1 Tax=unclassified Aureimonas TaxID=2615206 RepID=UPI000701F6ED|nr:MULTISPECIES: glutathione S-transferase family protein [unclassified Aureimonas]KQT70028.1 glutathione S-transferase [Aureimonas sp. Leaf427]KQT81063.1 glutathione S-transferase [Aureimonas sp. Leaf460]